MQVSRRVLLGVGGLAVVAGGGAALYLGMSGAPESPRQGGSGGSVTGGFDAATLDPRLADRSLGRADAPVVVREFFSLTCGHCATFHRDTMPRLKTELLESGRMRLVLHDFPLDQLALSAAAVARSLPAAAYEPFVSALLASQERWVFARNANPTEELARMAALAGMSRAAFDAAIGDEALKTAILKAREEFNRAYSIDSTPSFIFNGPNMRNQREAGARPFSEFARLVSQAAG